MWIGRISVKRFFYLDPNIPAQKEDYKPFPNRMFLCVWIARVIIRRNLE